MATTDIEIVLNEKYPNEEYPNGGNFLHFLIDILCHCYCKEFDSTIFLYLLFQLIHSNKMDTNSVDYYGNKPLDIITYDDDLLSFKINIKFIIFNMMTNRYINKIKLRFEKWKQVSLYTCVIKKSIKCQYRQKPKVCIL